jgi:short chain dehydrogenase
MTEELILDTPVLPKQAVPKLLKGQQALVTGANSGIGKAVAIALGEAGADVVVNYVRGDLSELVHEGQKVCPLSLLCREGLLYFQGFTRPRKPRTKGSPPAEE